METKELEIPVLRKTKIISEKEEAHPASGCCTPKAAASVCCEPSESKADNNGACCAQPEDGSVCCDK